MKSKSVNGAQMFATGHVPRCVIDSVSSYHETERKIYFRFSSVLNGPTE